ncbi:MAG TPA: hypothetical protein VJZ71_01725 [Phycisphaerae bacterium]|nr:hypothetical protein [Phycisphaerae bacterium]
MSDNDRSQTATDPFSQFWGDFFSRVGMSPASAAAPQTPSPSKEAVQQMQRVFFDALAKYCDDFMRSEQFLKMMKETMDRSLAFKQQVDQFLANLQRGMQSPAKADMDDLGGLLRSIEERVLSRLSALEDKVAAVEETRRTGRSAKASQAQRPSGRAARKVASGPRAGRGKRRTRPR